MIPYKNFRKSSDSVCVVLGQTMTRVFHVDRVKRLHKDRFGKGILKAKIMNRQIRLSVAVGTVLCLFLATAVAQQKAAKKEYVFNGKIEKIDVNAKRVTVANEKVDGWMSAMSMAYKVDKDEVLKTLKPGDQIT